MKTLCLLSILLANIYTPSYAATKVETEDGKKYTLLQTGVASWYGEHEAGRLTSNGERFNPNAMTCAHNTLPMNSVLRVTNTENGESAICRVNDRGGFRKYHRLIDVSRKVSYQLGFTKKGITKVKIEVVRLGNLSLMAEAKTSGQR